MGRVAPAQRDRHHVAVVFDDDRNAEFVFQHVGERDVGLRRDRRPQHGAGGRIRGALDGEHDARDPPGPDRRIVETPPYERRTFTDQLAARQGLGVEPPVFLRDRVAGVVDDGDRQEIQRQHHAEHESRARLEGKPDLRTAPPGGGMSALAFAEDAFGDEVGRDRRYGRMAEARLRGDRGARDLPYGPTHRRKHQGAIAPAQVVVAHSGRHPYLLQAPALVASPSREAGNGPILIQRSIACHRLFRITKKM